MGHVTIGGYTAVYLSYLSIYVYYDRMCAVVVRAACLCLCLCLCTAFAVGPPCLCTSSIHHLCASPPPSHACSFPHSGVISCWGITHLVLVTKLTMVMSLSCVGDLFCDGSLCCPTCCEIHTCGELMPSLLGHSTCCYCSARL